MIGMVLKNDARMNENEYGFEIRCIPAYQAQPLLPIDASASAYLFTPDQTQEEPYD